jgi:hypothetical protein
MTNTETLAIVHNFFERVGYAGLILPSGWFGRPYDSFFQLTRSDTDEQSLLVELAGRLVLTFVGQPLAVVTATRLQFTAFTSLLWDWTEFGSSKVSYHEEFTSGMVEFVAPM